MVLFLVFVVAACGDAEEETIVEIAMVTDYGDIDDESFNQGTWEGIVAFAERYDIAHAHYRPADISDSDYIDAIDMAVADGAKIIITPGFLFQRAIYESQEKHPDVYFVLLDAEPVSGDGDVVVGDNTISIYYDEHESGFLAGYAAVYDGFTDLGFMGGIAVPAVVRFGIGFVAGAYYAANELDVTLTFPDNRYTYLDTFSPGEGVETQAAGWFQGGTEIIFAAAGGAGGSVMSAASDQNAWMIGVDVDQSGESDKVLTSAMKALAESVELVLYEYYNSSILDLHLGEAFPGGETRYLSATEDGVALPMESSRFTTFDQDAYDDIFEALADGDIEVPQTYAELVAFFTEHELDDLEINEGTIE